MSQFNICIPVTLFNVICSSSSWVNVLYSNQGSTLWYPEMNLAPWLSLKGSPKIGSDLFIDIPVNRRKENITSCSGKTHFGFKFSDWFWFRDGSQKKVEGLTELKYYLKQQKEDVLFLDDIKFKNDKDEDIVSNKVGANKIAKQLALQWIKENTK